MNRCPLGDPGTVLDDGRLWQEAHGADAKEIMPLLIDELQRQWPNAKRQTLRRMLAAGRVRVNGKRAIALKMELAEGDEVVVLEQAPAEAARDRAVPDRAAPPRRRQRVPETRPGGEGLRIVYEDGDVLVVHKPAGLLTSTTPREPRPTLLKLVREHVKDQPGRATAGLIHRLDRDASGLLVFSKNAKAYESLKTQFYGHTVERVYLALVHGTPNPPSGRIENQLTELTTGKVVRTRVHGKGQRAVTDYEWVEKRGRQSLVRVTLQTGRKHQIRAHLSQRGWPIVGDGVYGANTGPSEGLRLCAVRLAFDHPRTGERCVFEVEADFGASTGEGEKHS